MTAPTTPAPTLSTVDQALQDTLDRLAVLHDDKRWERQALHAQQMLMLAYDCRAAYAGNPQNAWFIDFNLCYNEINDMINLYHEIRYERQTRSHVKWWQAVISYAIGGGVMFVISWLLVMWWDYHLLRSG